MVHAAKAAGAVIHPDMAFEGGVCGFSAFAKAAIPPASIVAQLPYDLALTPRRALATEPGVQLAAQAQVDAEAGLPPLPPRLYMYMVCLALRLNSGPGQAALWHAYMNSIPPLQDAGVIWDAEQLTWLAGTNAGQGIAVRQATLALAHKECLGVLARLRQRLGGDKVTLQPDMMTWDDFLWVHAAFKSRAFPLRVAGEAEEEGPPPAADASLWEAFPGGALLPIMDTLNHHHASSLVWECEDGGLVFRSQGGVPAGEEVFNNYGAKGGEELLIGFGFHPADNPHDSVACALPPRPAAPALQAALKQVGAAGRVQYVWADGHPATQLLLRLLLPMLQSADEAALAAWCSGREVSAPGTLWRGAVACVSAFTFRHFWTTLASMLQAKLAAVPQAGQDDATAPALCEDTTPQQGLPTLAAAAAQRWSYRRRVAAAYVASQRGILAAGLAFAQRQALSCVLHIRQHTSGVGAPLAAPPAPPQDAVLNTPGHACELVWGSAQDTLLLRRACSPNSSGSTCLLSVPVTACLPACAGEAGWRASRLPSAVVQAAGGDPDNTPMLQAVHLAMAWQAGGEGMSGLQRVVQADTAAPPAKRPRQGPASTYPNTAPPALWQAQSWATLPTESEMLPLQDVAQHLAEQWAQDAEQVRDLWPSAAGSPPTPEAIAEASAAVMRHAITLPGSGEPETLLPPVALPLVAQVHGACHILAYWRREGVDTLQLVTAAPEEALVPGAKVAVVPHPQLYDPMEDALLACCEPGAAWPASHISLKLPPQPST